jgi:hypothetical protein
LAVGAVIGIRDAGKTKKPPDAHILHAESTGDGLREKSAFNVPNALDRSSQ